MDKRQTRKETLLLLDRDGTLIVDADYPKDPNRVRLYAGVPEALRQLKKAGFTLVVVSNQSGIGRGLISLRQAKLVNQRFIQLLQSKKASVDGIYWCPHQPSERCSCRKPQLGMVKRAAKDLNVPWRGSISIGDRGSDIQMGQRTGGLGILVQTGQGRRWVKKSGADFVARNFKGAASWILKKMN